MWKGNQSFCRVDPVVDSCDPLFHLLDTESSSLSQYLPPFQVFHVCEPGNAQHDFLCPEGTIFNQKYIVCDWWYNVDCPKSPDFFELNLEFFKVFQAPLDSAASQNRNYIRWRREASFLLLHP